MSKLVPAFSILIAISFVISACNPSPTASPTSVVQTSTAPSTVISDRTATPDNISQSTQTSTVAPIPAETVRVPEDQPNIQAGIDAAPDGGLVLVGPGTYTENLTIADKSVTLASHFHTTGDEQFINDTVIDGNGQTVIAVSRTAGPDTKIIGFTIQNGDDGIEARADIEVLNNRIWNNDDGIDYTNSGGLNQGNIYEANSDDGIDLDGASYATIENNIIRNNENDGIEIRFHEYSGPVLNIVIRNNTISGNVEDGIQLIDYPDLSERVIRIERNLIQGNLMAGLGLMDNGDTREDFRAASIPERIYLINNTFLDNPYSVSGGDNLIALNNLFLNSSTLALKNVDADSIAAYNLFWNNASDSQGSNIDTNNTLFTSPSLDASFRLQQDSPAIDTGTARFEWNGEIVWDISTSDFFGTAPDLGAFETDF
jgi:parallel beta-helix repeat protein